ncbi:MAG: AAA family ATPase [Chloroflexota bacterium]
MNEDLHTTFFALVPRVRLVVLRITWLLLAALILGFFILSISPRLLELTQLPYLERATLEIDLGFSVEAYAVYVFAIEAIVLLAFFATAAIIYWQKSDDWVVFLVSASLMTFVAAVIPAYDTLARAAPKTESMVALLHILGVGLTLWVLYIFPDGHFIPSWTCILARIGGGWLLLWVIFSPTADFSLATRFLQVLTYTFMPDPMHADRVVDALRVSALSFVLLLWFATGLVAQMHRYRNTSTEAQRQQTRWIVFSLLIAFIGYFAYNLPQQIIPAFKEPGYSRLVYVIIGEPIYLITLITVPVFITVSITYHRLWNIDFLINRTLVYGAVTGVLGAMYFLSIIVLQKISLALTGGERSEFIVGVTTVVFTLLFMPVRRRIQQLVDRRFYREQVDFRAAFTEFSQQVRTIIELPELLHVLVERTTQLYHAAYGAVYLYQGKTCHLADSVSLPECAAGDLTLTQAELAQLQMGNTLSRLRDDCFALLIPLMAPKTQPTSPAADAEGTQSPLQGVLALGPRLSGLSYFRQDIALLRGLADQAGTSIYVARLIGEKQAEAQRLAEAERHLAEHRNSPLGRAEDFAAEVLELPDERLLRLYKLAQAAGADIHAAELLHNLPQVFFNQGKPDYGRLAQGFEYVYLSRRQPEMLPVGLRTLIAQLEENAKAGNASRDNPWVLKLIRLCLSSLDANAITQVTDIGPLLLPDEQVNLIRQNAPHLGDILDMFEGQREVINSLRAYERLDAPEDKLAYLAAAVERLSRLERMARTRYGGADRPMVQGIVEKWLAIVTRAMSDLQARAHITCELLTRHTWQSETVSVVLSLRNDGRSAAFNVRTTLLPSPEYVVLEERAHFERLSPGEEVQMTARVQPQSDPVKAGSSQFRVRFTVVYTDPGGADQVENFADVMHLMQTTTEFRFIPNPYVVGTPLQSGSPLFFGREDVVGFIQENLAAAHRNNLVLIGQRRTGKTSLLKQLPARLDDGYLPVFLDGQALGLDPGLANFFLSLATEICFALEDRGFEIEMPELSDFTESPTYAFEHRFLPKMWRAIGEERHVLLMLDEFEELEASVRRGDLDASIFGFIRHIIQHYENLSVIFCGTHRLEELASNYWNVLFNISLYRHITLLDRGEAFRLVQEPVAGFGMRYDDLALDKIWRVTAGHPYFLQLMCHSLVNRHNKTQRPYITVADVNAALEDILASGEAHFVYLWNEAGSVEKLTLTALSRMGPQANYITAAEVADFLVERGIPTDRQAVNEALHHLALRDVLSTTQSADQISDEYAWKLGLLGLWVEKYKSLNRVVDEVTLK